jgi:hypothetical protein
MSTNIGYVKEDYTDDSNKYEYYNPLNIYNYLGYWDREIYRFGIVYILDDFSLSPVFNICGRNVLNAVDITGEDIEDISKVTINKDTYAINENLNCKGVSRINIGNSA